MDRRKINEDEFIGAEVSKTTKNEIVRNLTVNIFKLTEYGDCYDDGKILVAEIVIDEVTYTRELLSYYPFYY